MYPKMQLCITFLCTCTKFVQPVGVTPTFTVDTEMKASKEHLILINKKRLIVAPASVIQQFKDYLATGQQSIRVLTAQDKVEALRFVTQEQYDNIEVTLETLEPIPEPVHYTSTDLPLNTVFEDTCGNRYFIAGYMQDKVLLYTILSPRGTSGDILTLQASFWVDLNASEEAETVSLHDFRIVVD